MDATKICSKCGEEKLLNCFGKDKYSKDGLTSTCKECRKKYYRDNKETISRRSKKYREVHKDEYKYRDINWVNTNYSKEWSRLTIKSHINNGYIVNIDREFLINLIDNIEYCPIYGCKFIKKYRIGRDNMQSPSLDRINNERELNEDNVWIICRKCNSTKLDRTMKEFVEYCGMVSKYKINDDTNEYICNVDDKKYSKIWASKTIKQHKYYGNIISITNKYLMSILDSLNRCPICGCVFVKEYGQGIIHESPSLDRIDNENELREDNVQIICRRCNTIKSDRTMNDFVKYCNNVYKKFEYLLK